MSRDYTNYLTWIHNEFLPLTLVTPETTLTQTLENACRYWNTHSAFKCLEMVSWNPGLKRVQLSKKFKMVVDVYPAKTTSWILEDMPIWSILGTQVLDNITSDLILLGEAFRNYRVYLGKDFQWWFEKNDDISEVNSDDSANGGYVYPINVPSGTSALCIIGSRRILQNEDFINIEPIWDWISRYWKTLVKQVEGNTIRKSSIISIQNDGQELVNEGKEEAKELTSRLAEDSRWVVAAKRC